MPPGHVVVFVCAWSYNLETSTKNNNHRRGVKFFCCTEARSTLRTCKHARARMNEMMIAAAHENLFRVRE